MSQIFTVEAHARLQKFLAENNQKSAVEVLTPDASTREYFRVNWNGHSAIACVYAEQFLAAEHNYFDVTHLFLANNLPVAQIYEFDENLGIIILEDFGDLILRDFLQQIDDASRDDLLHQAISLIARIQSTTDLAFERNSIASRLRFDEEKLSWELNFFKTHYFETLRQAKLSPAEDSALIAEFDALSTELSNRASVLCHRDFHAANLMLDREMRLRIIDHQDARIGTSSYDLVSLLLDRVTEPPDPVWLDEKKQFFLTARENFGLEKIDLTAFDYEFQLQTIQRCLKAIGTFSYQSVNRGKTHYVQFMNPMFRIVRQAAEQTGRYPVLRNTIDRELSE
jgi:hypothetical protein